MTCTHQPHYGDPSERNTDLWWDYWSCPVEVSAPKPVFVTPGQAWQQRDCEQHEHLLTCADDIMRYFHPIPNRQDYQYLSSDHPNSTIWHLILDEENYTENVPVHGQCEGN